MCRQSSWRFLQSLLRFIGTAFLLMLILAAQVAMLAAEAAAQTHPGGVITINTSVNAQPRSSVHGTPVSSTVTATASGSTNCSLCHPNSAGQQNMKMQVIFNDGSNNPISPNLSLVYDGSSPPASPTYLATFTDANLPVGPHTIIAALTADFLFSPSFAFSNPSPSALEITVVPGTTTTSVASSANPSAAGQSVTFTATVAVTTGAGTPTGTVTFLDGGGTLGTASLGGSAATFTTTQLAVGSHSITAVYNGDPNFLGSTSQPLTQTVLSGTRPTITTLVSAINPSSPAQSVTFTATVAPATGTGTPTGTVTFQDGGSPRGTGNLSGGTTSFTTNQLPPGNHSITAVYSGDANFLGSTSQPLTQIVRLASATHDFNNDGESDILWRDASGNVATWLMNGAQVKQASVVGNAPTTWSVVGQRDFNGDGKSDILWRDTSGNVAMWMMNGAQVTQAAGVGSAPASVWSIIETGDFNDDGKSDILWQDTNGDVAIWFMNGTQVAQAAGAGNVPTSVWTIQRVNAD